MAVTYGCELDDGIGEPWSDMDAGIEDPEGTLDEQWWGEADDYGDL